MPKKLTYSDDDLSGIIFTPSLRVKLSAKPDIIIKEPEDEVNE